MNPSTSPVASGEPAVPAHKRTYQACIPCRRRKVRCDLGSVDEPHDPPCVRCRREKKDCFFTETRRKRKAGEDGNAELSDDYVARNRRSNIGPAEYQEDHEVNSGSGRNGSLPYGYYRDSQDPEQQADQDGNGLIQAYGDSGPGGNPASSHLARKAQKPSPSRQVKNETAAALFQSPISNPADALHLLVNAVAQTEDLERRGAKEALAAQNLDWKDPATRTSLSNIAIKHQSHPVIDPALTATPTPAVLDPDTKSALQAWSRLRFVRAGWLTAREALAYVSYYYVHLAPLTPITPPDFSKPGSHLKLLSEEPMLAITLLTIASRHKSVKGPAGRSRSFMIHEKLWHYLQGMITRMFWAQEQFGGGFCGAGASSTPKEIEARRRGLRSLGTVESLLLLSDWHPRSMHFPPGDDGDELLAPLLSDGEDQEALTGTTRTANTGWTEPALRSDRMCWSLVGCAYTLSFELGVFDSLTKTGRWLPEPQAKTAYDPDRADRVGRLLHIYITQAAGRFGYPNMLPLQGDDSDIAYLKIELPTAGAPQVVTTSEQIQRAWAELAAIMRLTNAELFESKQQTSDRIKSGEYLGLLEAYWPRLRQWLTRFESIENVPPLSRTILMMEYEYSRTYINSLSLQAFLEHCAAAPEENSHAATAQESSNNANTPPALLPSYLQEFYKQNAKYINEVVEASRNLLRLVVDGLVPHDGLRHAPVRTHFRILSGAMFLLKTFALGAKESEVYTSITLLDLTVNALRTNHVDDVHICLRIADLLEGLTSMIRTKFRRLPVASRGTKRSSHQSKPSLSQQNLSKAVNKPLISSTLERRPGNMSASAVNGRTLNVDAYAQDSMRTTGPLAGISTPLVDPNDASITIMPPLDYIYNPSTAYFENPSLYQQQGGVQLSPHATNASFSPHAHNFSPNGAMQSPPLGHDGVQAQAGFSFPSSQPFSPLSTGSGGGGYNWLTLDVNPLINQAQNGNSNINSIGASPWSGNFGPEIGDSLDMLGALGDGYPFIGDSDGGPGWL